MINIEKLRLYLFPKTVYRSDDGELAVVDRIENGAPVRVLFTNGVRESGVFLDKDRSSEPLFYYMRTFKDIFSRYDGVHKVLMIGGAGLTFARVFLDIRKENTMTVIEKDARYIKIADQCFDIRPNDRLAVHILPGEKYIAEMVRHDIEPDELFDAILVDAFDGNKIAKELTTEPILKMARLLMAPKGLFIMNAINEKGGNIAMHTYMTEAFLKKLFAHTKIIECENEGNCVLVASDRMLNG